MLRALLIGSNCASELNPRTVIFRTDSAVVPQMVRPIMTSSLLFKSLLDKIHALLNSSAWPFSIHHSYREVIVGFVIETLSSSFHYLSILIQNDYSSISYLHIIS